MKLYTYHRNLKGYQINMGTNINKYVNDMKGRIKLADKEVGYEMKKYAYYTRTEEEKQYSIYFIGRVMYIIKNYRKVLLDCFLQSIQESV